MRPQGLNCKKVEVIKSELKDIIDEIVIGKDNNIEKIYFSDRNLIYGYKVDTLSNKKEKCVYIPTENEYKYYKDFLTKEE